MLIRFEVENFRSFREPAELSLVAVDENRREARSKQSLGHSLLTTAGIFGPNASGKTNMLAALEWLSVAISSSLRTWDEEIPVVPFAFGNSKSTDSSFTLELEVEGTRFEYVLDLGVNHVSFEALYHYPQGRKKKIYERERNRLILQRGLGELSGTRALLTDRSLALSIMRRFDERLTSSFIRQVTQIVSLGKPLNRSRIPRYYGSRSTLRVFELSQNEELEFFQDDNLSEFSDLHSLRQRGMALLQLADLGISDVIIEEQSIKTLQGESRIRSVPRLVHISNNENIPFEYSDESLGTRNWFDLIGPLLFALQNGSLVLFDEIDSSLHPTLTAKIIDLFHNDVSNPNGAQLIFTSHDTNLLNHLNRDEVWFTDKNANGATRFGALSDFAGERVRQSLNIESGYLSGRFGALPEVNRLEVLRELGLVP